MISVVTINYNNKEGLKRTIESVFSQTYKNYEFILVDGGSNDGSVELIQQYKITNYISEKDRGISHAFNKGILKAKGDWILFLNSGDTLKNSSSLSEIEEDLDLSFDIIQCCVDVVDNTGTVLRRIPYERVKNNRLFSMPHQGMIHSKLFFEKTGLYSESFKYSMDYDLCTRKSNITIKYVDKVLSYMEAGGVSQQNEKRVLRDFLATQLLNMPEFSVRKLYSLYCKRCVKLFIKKVLGKEK